jgi:branched-chain amino acid transport system permease protein
MSSKTQYWYGIFGAIFILATIYFPRGVLGEIQHRLCQSRMPDAAADKEGRA